jgi:DNA-binding PucR family transcriptional regulator
VHEVLGPLARNTEAAERLRQTLRAFLTTGGSYTETAKLLVLHRNSVKYRVEQAERQLGRALDDGRLDLQLALQVFHLLGASVLQP